MALYQTKSKHWNIVRQFHLSSVGMVRRFTGIEFLTSYFILTAFGFNGVGFLLFFPWNCSGYNFFFEKITHEELLNEEYL